MRFVIVGAGGIGLLIGSYLSRGGHDVVFIEKKEKLVTSINKHGIGLMGLEATSHDDITYFPAAAVVESSEIKECDTVLLAVKSFDALDAAQSAAHLITAKTPVLILQTGLGNLEKMEKVVCRKNVLGGFSYMAAAALGPGRVRLGGVGKTFIGEFDGRSSARCQSLCKIFTNCGLEAELVHDIIKQLWCKVIVFSPINTLSGVLKVKNGQLIERMEAITLAKRMIDEGVSVAEACGVSLVDYDLYELFFSACRQTSDNISSMLLDLISGRRTEIDALCGQIFRLGKEKHVSVVTHQSMTELVKLCEKWGTGFQQKV